MPAFSGYLKKLTLLLMMLLFVTAGCSTTRPERLDLAQIDQQATLNSLSSDISINFKNKNKSGTANGMMLYKRPDLYRFVLLSPFGNTLMEAALAGRQLTLVYPAQKVAFKGDIASLPAGIGYEAWKLLPMMFEQQQHGSLSALEQPDDGVTTTYYDNGLVHEKRDHTGDTITYNDYTVISGLALAATYDFSSLTKDSQVRLQLRNPEVNPLLEPAMFSPNLHGMPVLPLYLLPKK